MSGHCPRHCPHRFGGYDPVRTPADLRIMRAALYGVTVLLFGLAYLLVLAVGFDGVAIGLAVMAFLTGAAAHGQTTILRVQRDHLGGHRR